jgi:L-seryl-tRNA(Ser) seleniumtransferase
MNKKTDKTKSKEGTLLRSIPSIDVLLKHDDVATLIAEHGLTLVKTTLKAAANDLRKSIRDTGQGETGAENLIEECERRIADTLKPNLRRAVNATGIILHTGLGRAPLPASSVAQIADCAAFCNLQTDLITGKRTHRETNLVEYVRALTGAEDAIAVNNNACATMLVLKALACGQEVVVSRGELIEIGGSFRLPDIMAESGAILREVGATNKTHAKDYKSAINKNTAVLFKAHKSNYSIVGFSKDVSIEEIAQIGKKQKVTVVDDLGCGALINTEDYSLPHEVTVRESLSAGADIALFSTDKLIGGPQGGMIVGKKKLIDKIRKDPMYRVLRICKLTLGALEGTLKFFLQPETLNKKHPLYTAMSRSESGLAKQAERVRKALSSVQPKWAIKAIDTTSMLGGGSLPGSDLPSRGVSIKAPAISAKNLAAAFRNAANPIFGRIEKDQFILDMRTVTKSDEKLIKDTASLS